MKKILSILAVAMVLCLSGCGEKSILRAIEGHAFANDELQIELYFLANGAMEYTYVDEEGVKQVDKTCTYGIVNECDIYVVNEKDRLGRYNYDKKGDRLIGSDGYIYEKVK